MSSRRRVELVIVGGGPAGLAAALEARRQGCRDILLIERDRALGGILNQCIHPGFGLHYFKTELTGPEYAARFVDEFKAAQIPCLLNAHVTAISPDKILEVIHPEGLSAIQAQAIILAMGCRERPRGALGLPGTRCAGIWTAGTAQRLMNLDGYLPGKRAVILGSGDIGLIMARRLTLEGINVEAVVELMPYSSGLTRNVVQCLQDFDIPLKLSHTVVEIHGRERLAGVSIAPVDPQTRQPDLARSQFIACDTLLLSVGLIPENELTRGAGVLIDAATRGPQVDQHLATSLAGVFACGNVLQVHDLVDDVSQEAENAARSAAVYLKSSNAETAETVVAAASVTALPILKGEGIRSLTPQSLRLTGDRQTITLHCRTDAVYRGAALCLRDQSGRLIISSRRKILTPGELTSLILPAEKQTGLSAGSTLQFSVEYLAAEKPAQSVDRIFSGPTQTGENQQPALTDTAGNPGTRSPLQSLTCISCPVGCQLTVHSDSQGQLVIEGAQCARGEVYARSEFSQPMRLLTTLIAVTGSQIPLSVRTTEPIPKHLLDQALTVIHPIPVKLPISIGQVILKNLLGTGVDVIATRDLA